MIGGMDEAGRGPAIGPIVFGLVVLTEEQEKILIDAGVKDSKALDENKRNTLLEIIKANSEFNNTKIVAASEIDRLRGEGFTMNQIEVESFRALLQTYSGTLAKLQLDAADVNEERFGSNFTDLTTGEIQSKHRGDALFVAVSAASICAKVVRDGEIKKLQAQLKKSDPDLPSFGSGYPTDSKPFLRAYVKKYKELPKIARKSWKTCSTILDEITGDKQSSLDDFL